MLVNLAVNVWCRSDSAFSRLCRIPWAVQKQRPVFSFLSAPGLVLQISNCSSVWRLRMGLFGCCSVGWHFRGSQACCCIKHSLLSGSSVVWRSDGPRGISVTNASSLSLKVRTNGVWGFFHLAAIFLQRKHLSIGLSPLPFLIMSDPVTVRLEKPLLRTLMQVSATGKSHS